MTPEQQLYEAVLRLCAARGLHLDQSAGAVVKVPLVNGSVIDVPVQELMAAGPNV